MQESAFDILQVPYYSQLDEDKLRERFQTLSAEQHPDQGGDEEEFKLLNQAYQTLRTPAGRLKELFAVYQIEFNPRGAISSELMDLFMSTGELIQVTDSHLKKKAEASSALAKALLEPTNLEIQDKISSQLEVIEQALETQLAHLGEIDRQGVQHVTDLATSTARNLTFLEKWRGQLRERFGQLF